MAAQAMSRLVDTSVRSSLKLTSRQWRILVVLNHLGTANSGEVAKTAGFDHSQVSRVAAELTSLGLAVQRMDDTDRRKQVLTLTEKGMETVRQGLPHSMHREHQLRSRLTETEYATFCHALAILTEETNAMLENEGKYQP